ncbi:hypothetical protein COU76_03545 [Candidatus Peregrinibacteria bacterium CG10_big_fil_rev_8_21_14_0_10_49_10]|nr:MAG: hypothetical protein COU76_03545 [Candidatus Peregrinibacteria bacterium CG10_big_fil_rev_8_21_14_0_10_49_10]
MIGALFLATIFGFLIGRIVHIKRSMEMAPTIQVVDDVRPKQAVVVLEGIRDGKIVGSLEGDVRLWIGENEVLANTGGTISVDPGPLIVNEMSVLVPQGMQFVASKRGKKYYPVLVAAGQSITPENRIYFESAEKAEAMGYIQ